MTEIDRSPVRAISTVEWAKKNGRPFQWRCQTDNYDPPRAFMAGHGYEYDGVNGSAGIILDNARNLKDFTSALYLIDNGEAVRAFYVASWHPEAEYVNLHAMPVNGGTRADNGRPIDYSGWQLGPRRAYHVKAWAVAL